MMSSGNLGVKLLLSESEIDDLYNREVKWSQGHRVNIDSRMLLLTFTRLFKLNRLSRKDIENLGVFVGTQYASLENYEKSDSAVMEGIPQPLAFGYALPSIPLACASCRFGIKGPTYSFMGSSHAGLTALEQAAVAISNSTVEKALVGAFAFKHSENSRSLSSFAFILDSNIACDIAPDSVNGIQGKCPGTVEMLENWAGKNGIASSNENLKQENTGIEK